MDRTRLIATTVFMVAWGVTTIALVIKNGASDIDAEWWLIPGIGLGGILYALSAAKDKDDKKHKSHDDEEP